MDEDEIKRHEIDPRRWGFMIGTKFQPVPKKPMLLAGIGPPPIDVKMPDSSIRHIIYEPQQKEIE